MVDLTARIKHALKLSFREFIGARGERLNIILGFLSLLELMKRGLIKVEQKGHFQDITMETTI